MKEKNFKKDNIGKGQKEKKRKGTGKRLNLPTAIVLALDEF